MVQLAVLRNAVVAIRDRINSPCLPSPLQSAVSLSSVSARKGSAVAKRSELTKGAPYKKVLRKAGSKARYFNDAFLEGSTLLYLVFHFTFLVTFMYTLR